MALNYSHRPVSPAHISGDNLVSPVRIGNGYFVEGLSEKNADVYSWPWNVGRVDTDEQNFSCGRDRVDCCRSKSTSKDIADLLPSDPFGMDIETTFTALTGWLEDLEFDCARYMRSNNWGISQDDYFAGWNLIRKNSLKYQQFPRTTQRLNTGMQSFPSNSLANEKSNTGTTYPPSRGNMYRDGDSRDMRTGFAPYDIGLALSMDDILGFGNGSGGCSAEMQPTEKLENSVDFDGAPHDALNYVLGYLGVKDLLCMERVCSSLSSTVRGDPLLWKTIHIGTSLKEITDDALVRLASRAQGRLECLSLVDCSKVTNNCLRRLLGTNRPLSKLCILGCTKITIECILNLIRAHNSNNEFGGIKHLRIGGHYGVNHEHFAELNSLLGSSNRKTESNQEPRFFRKGDSYLLYDDDRAIDIEICPICENIRLIYDCPAEDCKVKDSSSLCRACIFCIKRCVQCGRCFDNTVYEETFIIEDVCSYCSKEDKLNRKIDSFSRGMEI